MSSGPDTHDLALIHADAAAAVRRGRLKRPDRQILGVLIAGTCLAALHTAVLIYRQHFAWDTWVMFGGATVLALQTLIYACSPKLWRPHFPRAMRRR